MYAPGRNGFGSEIIGRRPHARAALLSRAATEPRLDRASRPWRAAIADADSIMG